VDWIVKVLTGCLYQKEAVREALVFSDLENAIYGVILDEMVDIIAQ